MMAMVPAFQIVSANATVLALASLALATIIVHGVNARPGKQALKRQALAHEARAYEAVGYHLATKFSRVCEPGTKALVIDRYRGTSGELFHQGFMKGFQAGITTNAKNIGVVTVERIASTASADVTGGPAAIMKNLAFSGAELDAIVKAHASPGLIISLIGLPDNFEASNTRIQTSQGDLKLVVLTDNVYRLGELIFNRELTACVVPKRLFAYDAISSDDLELQQLMNMRFYYLDSDNIIKILRKDRRMFQASKVY